MAEGKEKTKRQVIESSSGHKASTSTSKSAFKDLRLDRNSGRRSISPASDDMHRGKGREESKRKRGQSPEVSKQRRRSRSRSRDRRRKHRRSSSRDRKHEHEKSKYKSSDEEGEKKVRFQDDSKHRRPQGPGPELTSPVDDIETKAVYADPHFHWNEHKRNLVKMFFLDSDYIKR